MYDPQFVIGDAVVEAPAVSESHAEAAALMAGAVAPASPAWGWMTWYAVANPDEARLHQAIDALASLDAGRAQAIVIMDDGWQQRLGDWHGS